MKQAAKNIKARVKEVKKLKSDVFLLRFTSSYISSNSYPGQFLHLKIKPVLLRRPLSIHRVQGKDVFILFRVRGKGTEALSRLKPGAALDIIGPLGKGFYVPRPASNVQHILIAGGLGVAPLVFLAKKLTETKDPKPKNQNLILLGAKTKKEVLCEKEFKDLGCKVYVATEDGSRGHKSTVVALLKGILRHTTCDLRYTIYACGPKEMFYEIHKIIKKYPGINCQVSFEQFMGCGLGVCHGCVIETKKGYKKVCKDGPVFNLRDIF
ncbi:MAG: dihydroorotate dehydrogenase electron transfer subunit [Candidatus Omnitrophica bacterium]|nr:dihydroorotate dehydrogenase electron transfer subunit [Candidatus Omnitrophota bacterium]MDD5429453.1 dihydroorotate dehydrogenase electron transfer subunit [Candidatus Omnitrophota bacterium]